MATAKKASPLHIAQFRENIAEVRQLLEIHKQLVGSGPGRKRDVEVLNKSAIVLVVACWEAFVEDLANLALDFMIENAQDHNAFSKTVLDRVASKNSGSGAWALAGDGWKKALRDNYSEILAKTSGVLNTPRAPQVNDLFLKALGLPSISDCWQWKGRTNAKAISSLDVLITLRGSIAHRVKNADGVYKREVVAALSLVSYLAAKSSNSVRAHINTAIGTHPWGRVTYKGVG